MNESMQEENNRPHTTESTVIPAQAAAAPTNSLLRDLMIPVSIVIAGLFIGMGLYFGGGASGGAVAIEGNPTPTQQPAQPSGNLDAYDPVTEDDHVRNGNYDAPIMIIEYSDYDCPFCGRFHETMKVVAEKYGENIGWVYRHFPLEQLHPQAPAVAVASECVAELGGNDAFWAFSDAYLAARSAGDQTAHGTLIPQLVTEVGVDRAAFSECFESGRFNADVQADVDDAIETGGRGTPWSIVVAPDGSTYPINGALPQNAIEQLIDGILAAE